MDFRASGAPVQEFFQLPIKASRPQWGLLLDLIIGILEDRGIKRNLSQFSDGFPISPLCALRDLRGEFFGRLKRNANGLAKTSARIVGKRRIKASQGRRRWALSCS